MVVTHWLRLLSARLSRSAVRRTVARKRRLPISLARTAETLEERTLLAAAWVSQGPFSATNGQVENVAPNDQIVGAIHAVLAHPSNANILYAGAANGGIWRTFNATAPNPNWEPLTDDLGSMSTGALVFDQADATRQTIYAGVGRFSSFGGRGTPRIGLLKTTDGGNNWSVVDGGGFLTGKNISGIVANGATITVSVNVADINSFNNIGIFRSTDGGTSFTQISLADGAVTGLPAGASYDLQHVPADPNTMYTSVNFGTTDGVYKSTNGGANWTKVSNATMDTLIGNNTSNVEFAVGAFNNVYVGIVNSGNPVGFFRSGDGGANWTAMDIPQTNENGTNVGLNPSGSKGPLTGTPEQIAGGQGAIHFSIVADPNNPNVVYAGGDRQPRSNGDTGSFPNSIGAQDFSGRLFRGDASQPAGSQWVHLTHSRTLGASGGGTLSSSSPHADSRDMTFDANGNLIEGDDGGIFRRTSPQNNNGDWFSLTGSLAVTEMHDVAYDSVSNTIISGNQDNGTTYQPSAGSQLWTVLHGGDGGDVAVDDRSLAASNQSIRYSSFQNLGGFRRTTWDAAGNLVSTVFPTLSGATIAGAFVTPVVLNAINPLRLVIQGQNGLFESLNQGNTITGIGATAFNSSSTQDAIAYGGRQGGTDNENVLWVGSGSDVFFRNAAGNVALTTADPTNQTIRDLAIDTDDFTACFVVDQNNVFQTTNSGAAWTDVTGNLLTLAQEIYSIVFVATTTVDAILVGTNRGVFGASTAALGTWVEIGNPSDLPNVIVDELEFDTVDNVLVAGTLGRGAWLLSNATTEIINQLGPSRLNITIDPLIISENGTAATATITRNGSLAAAMIVNLTSSDVTEATVPATVTIAAGSASATFLVTPADDLVPDGTQLVTITGTFAGFSDGTAQVAVIDNETAGLTVTVDPSSMLENSGSALGTVTRNSGTFGDLVVTLSSSDPTEAGLPATVTIRDGQSSATFAIFAVDDLIPDGTQTVTISATAPGHTFNTSDTIDVIDDEALTLTISPLRISENGGTATGTVTRHLGTVGDLVVFLTSSNTGEARVPASVTIRNGQASATFTVTGINELIADGDQQVTITANAPGFGVKSQIMTVVDDDVPTITMTLRATTMNEAGGFIVGTVTRNTPPVGALIVRLSSSDTTEATVPVAVLIPDGAFSANFIIRAVDDAIEDPIQLVTITASSPGFVSASQQITVIDNDSVHLRGTNGGDRFEFHAGEAGIGHLIRVNGVATRLARTIRIVRFFGLGGSDQLQAFGTSGSDQAFLAQGGGQFTGPQFSMFAQGVETNTFNARGGANQTARFGDTPGSDRFTAAPLNAVMSGAGLLNTAIGFSKHIATAIRGGVDVAVLSDSAGNDAFSGTSAASHLAGVGFQSTVKLFDRVEAQALRGGFDVAEFRDTAGNETFRGARDLSSLTGAGFFYSTAGFDRVQAIAGSGLDTAVLEGSAAGDTLTARGNGATLTSVGSEVTAFRFDDVTVAGNGGADTAYLYDSAREDFFSGVDGLATLRGVGYIIRTSTFESVSIFGYFGVNRRTVSSPDYAFREFGNWL